VTPAGIIDPGYNAAAPRSGTSDLRLLISDLRTDPCHSRIELIGISEIEGKAATGSGERVGKKRVSNSWFKSCGKKIVKKKVLTFFGVPD
jgi:hypothetical protein